MLVQLLGFAHPRDLFEAGGFADVFRRTWAFAASICFRSTEAYATHMGVPDAFEALHREPLLPITPKQRGMVGNDRSEESGKNVG